MGGNALKHTTTRRYSREEYLALEGQVVSTLRQRLNAQVEPIRAYATKPSFGDMDLLVVLPPGFTADIKAALLDIFNPTELVKNGNVYSFDVKALQIDVILTSANDIRMSSCYFAYNDLGNLMGRIAHKLGFKYGHTGLSVMVKDGDYVIGEHYVSRDPATIFAFLGYDYNRFKQGFATVEDIYRYVVTTPYFNRDIYLLDNRNHVSRVRDAKRKTYTEFLQWLQQPPITIPAYPWDKLAEQGGRRLTPDILAKAESFFPGTQRAVALLHAQREKVVASHAKWNGNLVAARTGLSGKELGAFMQRVKLELTAEDPDIHALILRKTEEDLIAIEDRLLSFDNGFSL